MAQKWNLIEIQNTKYLIKYRRDEQKVECALTNLITAWNEEINLPELVDRAKSQNPLIEYERDIVINSILDASDRVEFNESSGILKFKYTIIVGSVAKIPFLFSWNLAKCSPEYFMEHITSTLLYTMVVLSEETRELKNIISSKDDEIEQYKYDGAVLSRKHLATKKFDDNIHQNRFKVNEVNKFSTIIGNSSKTTQVLNMCNIDVDVNVFRTTSQLVSHVKTEDVEVQSSATSNNTSSLNLPGEKKRKNLTFKEKCSMALSKKMEYDDSESNSDSSSKEVKLLSETNDSIFEAGASKEPKRPKKIQNFSLNIGCTKMENMEADLPSTSPEVKESANMDSLPKKSQAIYSSAYSNFENFMLRNGIACVSENVVLSYMSELSQTRKSSTLWSQYSMLRATLSIKKNIDISKYTKLRAFLKQKNDGFVAKKSKIFTKEQFDMFLQTPDELFLMHKVALIFGISGACRREELAHIAMDDIEDLGSAVLINVPGNKTNMPRSFTVTGEYVHIYKKYAALRPDGVNDRRFFLSYRNGKCTRQVVGLHKFGSIPKEIATHLNLPFASDYTGHCFRKTSATLRVNAGADLTALKRHDDWKSDKSSTVAKGYIGESLNNKIDVTNRTLNTPQTSHVLTASSTISEIDWELKTDVEIKTETFSD